MRAILLSALALAACTPDAPCLEDRQCPTGTLCVAGECEDGAVEGRADALYITEFRLRLEVDCGACHYAGRDDLLPTPGDGRWRFYRGGTISQAQLEASWLDLLDFVGGATPDDTLLLKFGRGQGGHPTVWRFPTRPEEQRLVNWLWTFDGRDPKPPEVDGGALDAPDMAPPPDQGPPREPADRGGYDALHGELLAGCGCHVGDPADESDWHIAQGDLAGSYAATLRYVVPGEPERSDLLLIGDAGTTRGGGAHPTPVAAPLRASLEAWIRGGPGTPEPEPEPGPDAGVDGGPAVEPASRAGYEALHGDFITGCGCHVGDPADESDWHIAQADVDGSYASTLRYVLAGDPVASNLLVIGDAGPTRNGGTHPTPIPAPLRARVEAWIRGDG